MMTEKIKLMECVLEGKLKYTFSLMELNEMKKKEPVSEEFGNNAMKLIKLGYVRFDDILSANGKVSFTKMERIVMDIGKDSDSDLVLQAVSSLPNKELYSYLLNNNKLDKLERHVLMTTFNVSDVALIYTIKLSECVLYSVGGHITCEGSDHSHIMTLCSKELVRLR